MKLPFLRPLKKTKDDRSTVDSRLKAIKKETRNDTVTDDISKLVKGIANGDSD